MRPIMCAHRLALLAIGLLLTACVEPPPSSAPPSPDSSADLANMLDADTPQEPDLAQPEDMRTPDAGDMGEPEDMPDADDMSEPDLPDIPATCPNSGCVNVGTSCVAGQLLTCVLGGDGCWVEASTSCEDSEYCDRAVNQCLPNPCEDKIQGELFCDEARTRVLNCQPSFIDGPLIPVERTVCGAEERCTGAGVCAPHACTTAELNTRRCQPNAPKNVQRCEANAEGLRQWVTVTTCTGSLQCDLSASGFCACAHQCSANTATCPRDSATYQTCFTDSSNCRTWRTSSCPAINTALGYDFDDLGTYIAPGGFQQRLVCYTRTSGFCGFRDL